MTQVLLAARQLLRWPGEAAVIRTRQRPDDAVGRALPDVVIAQHPMNLSSILSA